MAAYNFIGFIALDALCPLIPAGDLSGGIEHKNGIIPDAVYQQTKVLLAFSQCFFYPLALGYVSRDRVGEFLLRYRNSVPCEPPVGTVFAYVTVFEGNTGMPWGLDSRSFGYRVLAIIRMCELRVGFRHQFLRGKAECLLPGRVYTLKKSVKTSNAKHVGR